MKVLQVLPYQSKSLSVAEHIAAKTLTKSMPAYRSFQNVSIFVSTVEKNATFLSYSRRINLCAGTRRTSTTRSQLDPAYPQILTLRASKIVLFFSGLHCPVSTMFPC